MYNELASWWPLISPAPDYAPEAAFILTALNEQSLLPPPDHASLLELGCGGGHLASHLKPSFAARVTLSDTAEPMLNVSRQLNPDCEHVHADMRHLRLPERTNAYDVVLAHDALAYMTTADDLLRCMRTAWVHCKPGGVAVFVPDDVCETFAEETRCEGSASDDGARAVRFVEWTYDPDPRDSVVTAQYVFVLREREERVRVVHEEHVFGLFAKEMWMQLLEMAGFAPTVLEDSYGRFCFFAVKAAG